MKRRINPKTDPRNYPLITTLYKTWIVLLSRGLLAIMFGVMAWCLPNDTITPLMLLFGVYTLVDGALGIATAMAGLQGQHYWWIIFVWGVISLAVGTLTLIAPEKTAMLLLSYVAIWAIATGILEVIATLYLRSDVYKISLQSEVYAEWVFVLFGISSIIFGGMLLVKHTAAILHMDWLIAPYGIVFGLLLLIIAFKVHSFGELMLKQYE
ncbi:MAG: HdeD family acid-resistance protein [Armatimonadota bacterium]